MAPGADFDSLIKEPHARAFAPEIDGSYSYRPIHNDSAIVKL
jgi:hypothetical protein